MEKNRISSGWIIAILGGCAVVAVCGAATFVFMLAAMWGSGSTDTTVYSPTPQQEPNPGVGDVLVGHRWRVHFTTMRNGRIFEADFKNGGRFDGIVTAPPDDVTFPPSQQINGKWNIVDDVLFLEWDWIWLPSDSYHEQIPIQISSVSEYNLQGVDREWDLWEFERID